MTVEFLAILHDMIGPDHLARLTTLGGIVRTLGIELATGTATPPRGSAMVIPSLHFGVCRAN
jgi:hypothetical protein